MHADGALQEQVAGDDAAGEPLIEGVSAWRLARSFVHDSTG